LRILFDARHIRDFGVGTYTRNLLKALSEIDRRNEYLLVTLPHDAAEFAALPANFRVVEYSGFDSDPLDHVRFPLFLKRQKPDLCHIPLNRVPWMMPKPYVVTCHDMVSLLFPSSQGGGKASQLERELFRRGLIRADRVIAVSQATRRDIENLLQIPLRRIRVIYNAPDPEFFAPSPPIDEIERTLERYSIHYPYLLYAGKIRPHKNVPRLVEAFAVLKGQLAGHPELANLRLLIIGDQIGQSPAVRRAMLHSRVENSVRFLGYVPFETLRTFYIAAKAFVMPSLYEGFGLPPLEAMASGTPVVVAENNSAPEVVGDAAVMVSPDNVFDMARGLLEVLLSPNLREELVERGRGQARSFRWSRAAELVLETYQEAVG
jgi:glycosyltransferase involved in cell wall biosynthesis